eukprot:CAMPEP_0116943186 /NCGR_PEP_ID=MMETSP0467-20121206/35044_1 /TAXON_ID=283647 /ORGANISM="Mesodinium pulex, Strain SPMC105" /LENGTH=44 /DNA_ID= /DNA_START= /DNA_END= /DNA_ORIENTATION=
MTEDTLDRLLGSLNKNGQPTSDLYKRLTSVLNKNKLNFDYLKSL